MHTQWPRSCGVIHLFHFEMTFIFHVRFYEKFDFSHLFIFLGGSDIVSTVINESEEEGQEARKFLEDVRVTSPQVCEFNWPCLFA